MKRLTGVWCVAAMLLLAWVSGATASAQTVTVPNASVEEGTSVPANWTLSGGEGAWQEAEGASGARAVIVTGTGEDSNFWRSENLSLEPSTLYRLKFRARHFGVTGGVGMSGPAFCNRDLGSVTEAWKPYTSFFVTPSDLAPEQSFIRFGQWHVKGAMAYDDFEILVAQPVYRRFNGLVLGNGETIQGNQYRFTMAVGAPTNASRPLAGHRCVYNTDRWVFAAGSEVVYRHALEGRQQSAAAVEVTVTSYTAGRLVVEASVDGSSWRSLGVATADGKVSLPLPADMFPAPAVSIRLRAEGDPAAADPNACALQVQGYNYTSTIDGAPLDARGITDFVAVRSADPRFKVTIESVGSYTPDATRALVARAENTTGAPLTVPYELAVSRNGEEAAPTTGESNLPVEPTALNVPYTLTGTPGLMDVRFTLGGNGGFRAEWSSALSILYAGNYGERLPVTTDAVGLWWASSGWKISQTRALPEAAGEALVIRAARNEAEAAQLVVRPAADLKGLTAQVAGPLTGPNGAALAPENVNILRVAYVDVAQPTDATGTPGMWPDPLPPLTAPVNVAAGTNQPLWIRVRVPQGTPAGVYNGAIALAAEGGYSVQAPIRVEVYDFDMPARPTCVSAFGFSPGEVFNYQKITDPAQQREVMDKYMAEFGAHHITPYNPAPLDDFTVTWPKTDDPAQLVPTIDWTAWDAAMTKAFDVYGFNSFQLKAPGLGGGTFHSRVEPDMLGFKEGTPQYQAAFNNYYKAVQEHLREKGWLDEAYVYWFDEPDPKDYDFVMNGFRKLKEAAPDIPRMLTEQPEPALAGGPNLWCPISNEYRQEPADARRAEGDKFWWYVCTGPKAPYVTLFIDHPGTEMRVWLWQTWQRKIDGILIWQSNYWTSPEAYPNAKQNPYADPMSWQTSYGLPVGERRPWGNGDGRFVYPPEAAASGAQEGAVLEGPVVSMRFEMLRDGVDDYEYFTILRRLIDQKAAVLAPEQKTAYEALLQVPVEVTTDATTFTTDPAPMEKHREALARAIEALSKM